MSDDESDAAAPSSSSSAPFDPSARALAASLQYLAGTQQPQSLRRLCARELSSAPPDSPSTALLRFWHAFASSRLGSVDGTESAIASLESLFASASGSELGLPIVALLLSAHNARLAGSKDKKRLLELKAKLKVVSKQSSEAALLLAGRYFLASNKVPKARQCIEKLISRNKKDVELLALFGWIYLQSGEDKYIEKSMQVFKKAAKLSLPNFDIAALMGRAKYFEYNGKPVKAIQALDSICKIYPTFLPAFEEKLRLLSVCSRWKDMPRVISEIRSKRLSADCAGESIAVCAAIALECFCTEAEPAKHERAVAALLQAIAREEGESGAAFWIWQCSQWLSRLSSRADGASLSLLSDALAAPTAAASASKAGPNINLLYESGYVALRRADYDTARAAFETVAAAALAVEKTEKAEEDDAAAAAAAAAAPAAGGKVNEDERLQKSSAAVGIILALLGSGAVAEASAAIDALPAEVAQYTSVTGAATPLPSLLLARASLAASESNPELTGRLLSELVEAHAAACVGRNPALDDESLAPVVANLHPGLPNAVSPLNRWVLAIDTWTVLQAAELTLRIVGIDGASASALAAVQARPVSALVAPQLDLLASMQGLLRTVLAFQPGSFDLWQCLALLAWVAQDAAAAAEAAAKAEALGGARAGQLKRIVAIAAAPAAAAAAAPAAGAGLSTPSKPLPASSASAAAGAAAAPNTAQRHQFKATLGAETGIDFDDDEEEDVDALFKAAADVGDEIASPAAGRAAREAQAEREAQQHLDDLESRSQNGEATRLAREAEAKRLKDEAVRRAAELEAAAALAESSKADQRAAELRKAEEIAALRAAREAEKRRQAEEIERAEREREEQRELDRQERMRQRAAAAAVAAGGVSEVTAIQSFDGGDDVAPLVALDREPDRKPLPQQMKWNRPADAIVIPAPISAAPAAAPGGSPNPSSSASSSPMLSPNGTGGGGGGGSYNPSPSPTGAPSVSGLQRPPSLSPGASSTQQYGGASPSPTNLAASAASSSAAQQQQQLRQLQQHQAAQSQQRSEEARLAQEKKEKIMAAGLQIDQAKKFTKTAFWGEVFLKHGRRGSPHERNVTLEVTGSELKFDWSSGQLKAHKNDIQLVEGKGTAVFQRATADRTRAERCFSIVTATRTLDLEAPSDETRDYWVMGIKLLLKYLK